ncbi:MAG: periplasmic heavy metal sensor [Candidatus Rokubacteria bacterium]|nr:periplasmic heavy metal sensor [Candidatus Rokubacteria bacterium]
MRRITVGLVVLTMLAGAGGLAAGEPPRPTFHDETDRAITEAIDHFRGLWARLERRLGPGARLPWGPPPSAAERPLISIMLDHRDDLGLSSEQVSRLEALRNDFAREAIRREADIRIAEMDLAALLEKDPVDLPQVEAKVREIARLRAELRIARLRTLEQGKAVLTAEQRSKLQSVLGGAGRGPRRAAGRDIRL